ncbi:MAG: hypothetical protein ACREIA_17500 [Opitutaceae bacterium]
MRNAKLLVLAASAAALVTITHAGILGERSLAATYDYAIIDEEGIDDARGLSLVYRQPVATGVDIDAGYSFLDSGVEGIDIDGHEAFATGTFYVTNQASKPYARAGLIWVEAEAGDFSEDDFGYMAEAGIEWQPNAALTLVPYVRWTDGFDDDDVADGTFSGGLLADYAFNSKWSAVARGELDDDSDAGLSLGARFRF